MTRPTFAQGDPVYARAGWSTQLSELQHNVSGWAEIVDGSTIRLHDFHYDGLGPQVYATLAHEDTQEALEAGPTVYLQPAFQAELAFKVNVPYGGATLDFKLPDGANLDDYSAISIWCADFDVNFGSGTFAAPQAYRLFLPAITLPVTQ